MVSAGLQHVRIVEAVTFTGLLKTEVGLESNMDSDKAGEDVGG